LAAVYAGFLCCDYAGLGPPWLPSTLKYTGLLLCLLTVLLGRRRAHTRGDWRTTTLALCLTAVADIFLLFTPWYVPGMMVFCCAHIAWLARYRLSAVRPAAMVTGAVFAVCIVLLLTGRGAPVLYIIGVLYAGLILTVTVCAFRSRLPKGMRLLAGLGMVLFLLCDVNVALYNLLPDSGLHHTFGVRMWLFYLPAQALLAASCVAWPPSPASGD